MVCIGIYRLKLQIDAKEARVQKERCDEKGIKEIYFSEPFGPSYHYSPQNATSFGDQPTLSTHKTVTKNRCRKMFYISLDCNSFSQGTLLIKSISKYALHRGVMVHVQPGIFQLEHCTSTMVDTS